MVKHGAKLTGAALLTGIVKCPQHWQCCLLRVYVPIPTRSLSVRAPAAPVVVRTAESICLRLYEYSDPDLGILGTSVGGARSTELITTACRRGVLRKVSTLPSLYVASDNMERIVFITRCEPKCKSSDA